MKKLVSFLLVLCMYVGVMLTACQEEHEHTYGTEWSKDAAYHWHACQGDTADRGCAEISDKEEHTWNDGEITTEATPEANGVKTFTCKCGHTKTEPVEYIIKTTVTEEEWALALAENNFYNVKIIFDEDLFAPGGDATITFEYCGEWLKYSFYDSEDGNVERTIKNDSAYITENDLYDILSTSDIIEFLNENLTAFSDFTYNEENAYYKSENGCIVKFENGMLKEVCVEEVTLQFYNWGNISINGSKA